MHCTVTFHANYSGGRLCTRDLDGMGYEVASFELKALGLQSNHGETSAQQIKANTTISAFTRGNALNIGHVRNFVE
jgi:hypothetical protein